MKTFTQQTDTPDQKLLSKLTDEVVSRYKDCPDPRLKEIMISLVKHLHSGLIKWVQNHVVSAPGEAVCDGIGELWFESDEAIP